PKQMDRFRDRFTLAGAKDDSRDGGDWLLPTNRLGLGRIRRLGPSPAGHAAFRYASLRATRGVHSRNRMRKVQGCTSVTHADSQTAILRHVWHLALRGRSRWSSTSASVNCWARPETRSYLSSCLF